jgi:thiol-disulfide isomerase/thioredoxin
MKPTHAYLALLPLALAGVTYLTVATPPREREAIAWQLPTELAHLDPGKSRLLDFSADWCGPCRKMQRTTFRDTDLAAFVKERFAPVRFEQRGQEMSKEMRDAMLRYGVGSFPTLVVINAEGRVVAKLEGFRSAQDLRADLERALAPPTRTRLDWCRPDSPALVEQTLPRVWLFGDEYGCTPCEALDSIMKAPELAAAFGEQFIFVRVSSNQLWKSLYARQKITSVPTIVVTDVGDRELGRLVGSATLAEVQRLLSLAAPGAKSPPTS